MRTRVAVTAMLALGMLGMPVLLGAQDTNRTRWSISAGISYIVGGTGYSTSSSSQFNLSATDTFVVLSGTDNVGHAALGVSRPLGRTALVARAELLYNRNEGKPLEFTWIPNARRALSEDDFLLSAGLEWDARPKGRWSPYLLTTAGIRNTRIGWSRDSSSSTADRYHWSIGPLLNLGAGWRTMVGSREFFAEWRFSFAGNVTGSRLMPVSIGLRF